MSCGRMDIVGYHFSLLDDAARGAAESHIRECPRCLDGYLALKRHADAQVSGAGRPSDRARARLREEVRRTFGSHRGVAWLRRPVPLYQVLVAALVALLAAAAPTIERWSRANGPEARAQLPVDSARPRALSLDIY